METVLRRWKESDETRNVVHYRQNRYAVPKGTYFPGRKARIETDDEKGTVTFYDAKTDELLAVHERYYGIGKLIGMPVNLVGKVISFLMAINICSQPIGQAFYGILFERFSGIPWAVIIGTVAISIVISLYSKKTFKIM